MSAIYHNTGSGPRGNKRLVLAIYMPAGWCDGDKASAMAAVDAFVKSDGDFAIVLPPGYVVELLAVGE